MPIYVYECKNCSNHFEIEQRIVEDSLTHCDKCDQDTLRRVIQPVGVAFKGAGFHINDYASSGSAPVASEASAPAPAPSATPATAAE